jgi:alpha-beta hydrolase superfamily lysophospholipase
LFVVTAAVSVAGIAVGLTCCTVVAAEEWGAWALVLPGRKPGALAEALGFRLDPVAPERRMGEPIEAVAADGVRLAGLWHPADPLAGAGEYAPPKAAGSGPAARGVVLVLHGFAEDPSALRDRMEGLNRHGWDVAALDIRAHGRSGGDRGSFGGREADDVRSWIDSLSADGRLSGPSLGAETPTVVAVWGRSMGAAIALRAAVNDRRVRAVVLEAPYLDLEATLAVVLRCNCVPLARPLARRILRRAERLAGVSLVKPRPVDLAPRLTAPALVLHGAEDTLIPLDDARRLARAFPRPAALIEVPGAGHNRVIEVGGHSVLERVAGFLDASALPDRREVGLP